MRRPGTSLNIVSPCHEPTEKMRDVEGGRHCFACNKKVVDLTQRTADEAEAIFAASGYDLCGEVQMKPSGVPAFRSRSLLAAGVAASLLAQGCGSLPASAPQANTSLTSRVAQAKDEPCEAVSPENEVADEAAPAQATELSDDDADAPDAGPPQPRYPVVRGRIASRH